MNATIISVGTELVAGQCLDTNSAWLASHLTAVGIHVSQHLTIGDDRADLAAAIQSALAGATYVIITGGLGPTLDDVTREALGDAIATPLELCSEAMGQIESFFVRWQRPMPESNRRQAMVPRGCEVIANPRGTAPGIHFHKDDLHLFALPGVPGEMKAMFDQAVLPAIQHQTGGRCTISRRLLCFGIPEAKLGDMLSDLMRRDRNPLVGTTASGAVLSVRILAEGRGPAEARGLIDQDVSEIRSRLGKFLFGEDDDTLEAVVAASLTRTGATIATAESCTGGLLAKRLTDIPGSSGYFLRGFVAYCNEAKMDDLEVHGDLLRQYGAVSAEVARALAENCRRKAAADYAISITGIAGPSGGSQDKPVGTVFIGLAERDSCDVKRVILGDHLSRTEIRDRACKSALNMLRLRLPGETGVGGTPPS